MRVYCMYCAVDHGSICGVLSTDQATGGVHINLSVGPRIYIYIYISVVLVFCGR